MRFFDLNLSGAVPEFLATGHPKSCFRLFQAIKARKMSFVPPTLAYRKGPPISLAGLF
jgi:hypothetical protein